MAHRSTVNKIVVAVSAAISDEQIDAISATTPNDFDVDAAINKLIAQGKKINPKDIVDAIKQSPMQRPEPCQRCDYPFGIPILDKYVHREAQAEGRGEYEWLTIPTTYVFCPNCSGSTRAIALIDRMSDEEKAWTWLLLYDFFIHKLRGTAKIDTFRPQDYWCGIEINPILTNHQMMIAGKICESANHRFKTQNQDPTIKKLTETALRKFPNESQSTIPF